jgi:alpha-beta hydrolase superfamily lysophospholipase
VWREGASRGHVVLLHGLGRTPLSMRHAASRLREAGYLPFSIGYPSRRQPIGALADIVASKLPGDATLPLHFLTHSLGGIVLRCLVKRHRPPNLGRAVMLVLDRALLDQAIHFFELGRFAHPSGSGQSTGS